MHASSSISRGCGSRHRRFCRCGPGRYQPVWQPGHGCTAGCGQQLKQFKQWRGIVQHGFGHAQAPQTSQAQLGTAGVRQLDGIGLHGIGKLYRHGKLHRFGKHDDPTPTEITSMLLLQRAAAVRCSLLSLRGGLQTLNLKKRMSPSLTTYSLPSDLSSPFSFTTCSLPRRKRSSQL